MPREISATGRTLPGCSRRRWEKPVVITPADVGSDTLDLKGIFATPDHYSPGLLTPIS